MITITTNTFQEDVIEIKAALKQMHSTGWKNRQYMNFELRSIKNHGGTLDDVDYAKKVFAAADPELRNIPVQGVLF